MRYGAFFDTSSPHRLSVDRLDLAPLGELTDIQRRNGQRRTPPRRFYGWGVVTRRDAEINGRTVHATPTEENPCHADIRIPHRGGAEEQAPFERNLLRIHAEQLAKAADWLEPQD